MYNSRGSKTIRSVIDVLNVILGIAAIILAVLVFINTEDNKWMFQIIFLVGAGMNFITGIKNLMTDKKVSGIVCMILAVLLCAISFISHTVIGGR